MALIVSPPSSALIALIADAQCDSVVIVLRSAKDSHVVPSVPSVFRTVYSLVQAGRVGAGTGNADGAGVGAGDGMMHSQKMYVVALLSTVAVLVLSVLK